MKFNYSGMTVQVHRRVREEHDNGAVSLKSVPDGTLRGDVFIEIDEALLHRLALKALKNRSRKAGIGGGLIVCRAKHVTRQP